MPEATDPVYLIHESGDQYRRAERDEWADAVDAGKAWVFVPAKPVPDPDPDLASDWTGWEEVTTASDTPVAFMRPTPEQTSGGAMAAMRGPVVMQLALDPGLGARVAPLGTALRNEAAWVRVPGLATVLARETGLRAPEWGHQFTPKLRQMAADMSAGFPAPERSPAEVLAEALECDSDGVVDLVRSLREAVDRARQRRLAAADPTVDDFVDVVTRDQAYRCPEPTCPLFGRLVDGKVHAHGDQPLPGVEETFGRESDA